MSFSEQKLREQEHGIYTNYRREVNNEVVNKYPVGIAVLQSPFYLISKLLGFKEYSRGQQFLHLIGALIILMLGLYHLKKLVINLGYNGDIALVMALCGNLIYYTIAEPFMSHVYGFALVCILLSLLYDLAHNNALNRAPWLFLITGLLIILRPSNALLLAFLPFILSLFNTDLKSLSSCLFQKWYWALLMLFPITIQIVVWYLGTGRLIVWSYPGEGFNWLSPHLTDVLTSFKKGLFIYTPVLILSVLAFYRFSLFKRKQIVYWFAGLFVVSYVISSWWSWYYGDSFGHRAFIEFYPVLILPGVISLSRIKKPYVVWALLFALFSFGVIQNWQYDAGILHPNSMSYKKYKAVFIKTGAAYSGYLGNEQEVPPHGVELKHLKQASIDAVESTGNQYLCETSFSSELPVFATIRCSKMSNQAIDYRNLWLVAQGFNEDNEQTFLHKIPYYDIADEGHGYWAHLETKILIPAAPLVKVYIHNPDYLDFKIKNYSAKYSLCVPSD